MLLQFIERLKLSAEQSTQLHILWFYQKDFPRNCITSYHNVVLFCCAVSCCHTCASVIYHHASAPALTNTHYLPVRFSWHHSSGALFSCPDYSTILLCICPMSSASGGYRFPPLTDSCLFSPHNHFEGSFCCLFVFLSVFCTLLELWSVGRSVSPICR